MRALVTGGNRYIGLDLVFELARRGHEVTVANSHEAPLPSGARRIHVDRRIPGALVKALEPHRDDFDVVFDHTAFQLSDVEPMVELFRGRMDSQLGERFGLDLTGAFARDRKPLADLCQSQRVGRVDAEAQPEHLLLARRERVEQLTEPLAEVLVRSLVERQRAP